MTTAQRTARTAEEICRAKVQHNTSAKALAAVGRSAGKFKAKGLHVYRCHVCKLWHLTHSKRLR